MEHYESNCELSTKEKSLLITHKDEMTLHKYELNTSSFLA